MIKYKKLEKAWRQVKKNKGAPGGDGMTISLFLEHEGLYLSIINKMINDGSYVPFPARRIYIEKDTGKKRPLGIPIIFDRIIGQAINNYLQRRIDYRFTKSNFGFRPGKSQHKAIYHTQKIIKTGKIYALSIDLEGFFDNIKHKMIITCLKQHNINYKIIDLIKKFLTSGYEESGKIYYNDYKGVPQGSPLSPILSNIVLNKLDWHLEKLNFYYCRWADDFVILFDRQEDAEKHYKTISTWIEKKLQLNINREKSKVALVDHTSFLGFTFDSQGKIKISDKSKLKFLDKVNKISNSEYLRRYMRGWTAYFRIAE